MSVFSVKLSKIATEFSLESIYFSDRQKENAAIFRSDVSRPGLNLCGYYEHFEPDRIQIIGNSEHGYLETLNHEKREDRMEAFFSLHPAAVIITRNLSVPEGLVEAAGKYDIPVFRTAEATSDFTAALISYLNVELAPRITQHGVLVEVYGEGVLLLGESGVGKSETAVELIKRGHRLIADDIVEIKRVSSKTLVGSSPDNVRHFLELRGIGVINARRIFGMGAVKLTEKIDMVIQMELWNPDKVYDRLGMENEQVEILGNKIPALTIPVKPGRNLAVIIEVAAMNNRQKKMGYNAAEELLSKLGLEGDNEELPNSEWDLY